MALQIGILNGNGLLPDECRKVAAAYPEIGFEEVIVEACCLTRDLGGSAGTRATGDDVAKAVSTA
jgi:isocitrate/isopropylmalate dehydrogenase